MNKIVIKILILSSVLLGMGNVVVAESFQAPLALRSEATVINTNLALKTDFVKAKFASAEKCFLQGNIKASRANFTEIISRTAHDDYVFLSFALKMAEFGLFDLFDDLVNKLDNNLFTENYVNDIYKYYYPSDKVSVAEVIYLSDAYASIVYNNLAIETTSELQNSNQVSVNDYKNYLIALGFYKSNNLSQALKYINNAIGENDKNIKPKYWQIQVNQSKL